MKPITLALLAIGAGAFVLWRRRGASTEGQADGGDVCAKLKDPRAVMACRAAAAAAGKLGVSPCAPLVGSLIGSCEDSIRDKVAAKCAGGTSATRIESRGTLTDGSTGYRAFECGSSTAHHFGCYSDGRPSKLSSIAAASERWCPMVPSSPSSPTDRPSETVRIYR